MLKKTTLSSSQTCEDASRFLKVLRLSGVKWLILAQMLEFRPKVKFFRVSLEANYHYFIADFYKY